TVQDVTMRGLTT
nr:immunoglobulin heavy chain junction region [Mus musculus]